MEEKDISHGSRLPHRLVDSHLGITPAIFHSPSLFPDILALTGVFSASWLALQLLGCTRGPASLVTAQCGDWRKSPETVTETLTVYWTGDLTGPQQKVLEWHPTVNGSWQADHGSHLRCLVGKEATIYRGNWHQVGSAVTRETSSWGRGQPCRQLLIKPYN